MARLRVLLRAFAAAAAFALALASTVVVSADSDSDGDGVSDAIEQATQRLVIVSPPDPLKFIVSSVLASGSLRDQFGVSYDSGTFDVWYERTGGAASAYQLEFRNLVEWVDSNGNGRIDSGSEVINATTLGSSAFGDIPVIRSNETDADGGRVFKFVIRSKTNEVTMNLTIAERFKRLASDRVLTPMEVKMDIAINHVLVQTGASVGIEIRMDTEDDFEYGEPSWDEIHGFAVGEGAVNVTGGPPGRSATVFFSWSKTALADDIQIPANVTTWEREPGSYELYLAYPIDSSQTPTSVLHDPTLGVESAVYEQILGTPPELQPDIALYAGTLAAVALLVAATIVVANRRRKRRED